MEPRNERRLVLAVRIHEFDARTVRMQDQMRQGMAEVLDRAAAHSGLDRASWSLVPGDGGELAILPPAEPEVRVADSFVRRLAAGLIEYDRLVATEARLRLRLAIHFGPANVEKHGFSGRAPRVARRLCDSVAAGRVLAETAAHLVVVVSAQIFEDTIAEQLTSLEADHLRKVDVRGESAWVWAPDHRLDGIDLERDEPGERADPSGREERSGRRHPDGAGPVPGAFHGAHVEIHGNGYLAARDMEIHYDGGSE
ncbi:hypothetical protein AB0L00_18305 [Actinoallomurus sp. NPDC052308]|uniref:hypothetical protein n=1 Tax=Actinoallomurus sp. NPDC052308 TaxID=3155530 RepID=UPI003425EA9A